jgi:glycyl-tRNA synthetase
MKPSSGVTLEKIISLCKRRGFVYQAADIYGGLNGVYDFGHLGTLLKKNIRTAWLDSIYAAQDDILLFEGSILEPEAVWKASGHLEHFNDPMVDCLNCKHRYRTDEIDLEKPCPVCGKKQWTDIRTFNMMFKTEVGASIDNVTTAYLRPETAQSIFINFKNALSTNRIKIPFGIAQIGKAFRNEINPKHFLFRMREFEQMELEWFCKAEHAVEFFEFWSKQQLSFCKSIGLNPNKLRLRPYNKEELSHYSRATSDIEYEFPFGWKELEGIADRGTYDLAQHTAASGKELTVYDEETKESYIPTVIESSIGVDRLFLTLLFDAYDQDMAEGEERIVLRFSPIIAPIKAAFLPLTKKLYEPTHELYHSLRKQGISVIFDDTGSIGKRYRRQDEIGTPFCFTYDFESENDHCITVRDRDTMKQQRIAIDQVPCYLTSMLKKDKI